MKPAAAMAKIKADVERIRKIFDLREANLGADLCKAATDGVQYALAAERDPDGNRWDDLSARYEAYKSYAFPGNPISLLHGTMDDPREVAGTVEVTATEAKVTYGVSEEARQEAAWFQEGDEDQPARPFWGITADADTEIRSILDRRFATA